MTHGSALHVISVAWISLYGLSAVASEQRPLADAASQVSPESAARPLSGAEATAWSVEVDAPEPLKTLLLQHLDLVRLRRMPTESDVSALELARLVEASPRQVRQLLQTEGYFDPKIGIERIAGGGHSQTPRVLIRVEPGQRTQVGPLELELRGEFAEARKANDHDALALLRQIQKVWPLPAGAPFRNPVWADAKTAVLTQLRAAGYAAASLADSRAEIDPAQQTAQLRLVIDSGPLFRSGSMDIEGLVLHDREAVLNNARFSPGTALTETLLLDFQERLLKSGLFQQASVSFDADPATAAATSLRIRVKEQAPHQLTTGLGYSSNVGPRITVEYLGRRFLGWPATLRNKAEWSEQRQALDGELSTHVRADNYRWFGGLTLERLVSDSDVVLAQRLRLGRALEFARIDRSQYVEWDRNTRRTEQARDVTEAVTVNQTLLWREIDNPLLPTRGETLGLRLGVGQIRNSGSGSGPAARAWGRATFYRPLGAGWFGQLRVEAGQVFAKKEAVVTDGLGFRAGGDGSVRGYAYRSLGPLRDGAVSSGKVVFTASAEVARPLSVNLPSLWGAAFVDTGDAADAWRDMRPVTGAGVGLRWRSPVGPLQMDLAHGFATGRVRLHFSVGIVF